MEKEPRRWRYMRRLMVFMLIVGVILLLAGLIVFGILGVMSVCAYVPLLIGGSFLVLALAIRIGFAVEMKRTKRE